MENGKKKRRPHVLDGDPKTLEEMLEIVESDLEFAIESEKAEKEIKEFVVECGFSYVGYEGEWKGKKVFFACYPRIEGETPPTVKPVIVFQEGKNFRILNAKEAFFFREDWD